MANNVVSIISLLVLEFIKKCMRKITTQLHSALTPNQFRSANEEDPNLAKQKGKFYSLLFHTYFPQKRI